MDRITANFRLAVDHRHPDGMLITDAVWVTDQEMVEMAHYMLREEGLFLGSSASMNCVAAVRAARALGPGHTIVLVLCDSGQRHLTKFWSKDFLSKWGLTPKPPGPSSDLSFIADVEEDG